MIAIDTTTGERIEVFDIPPDIYEAAAKVHAYFYERGTIQWEFADICSRNHAHRLNEIYRRMDAFREGHQA